jgi:uncharacterized protein with ATP-grasp and redox domains
MNTSLDCIPCFVRQAAEAVGLSVADESRRADIMRSVLSQLAGSDWNGSPTVVAQRLHRGIRKETGDPDPYGAFKARMNRLALELLPCLRQAARLEEQPGTAMVRVALAGSLINAGAKRGLSEMDVRTAVCRACRGDCPIDLARDLFLAAEQARHILFLTDNAGEIVLDRVLIEALPTARMVVGVRGSPVINDATVADAEMAGLQDIVTVMPNGSDAPGTLLDDCSDDFRRVFEASDLIIVKGQGNYASLHTTAKHVFFLLHVTCPCVAAHSGVPVGSMAICERNGTAAKQRNCVLP